MVHLKFSSQKKSYMKSSKAQAGKGPKEEEERPLTKQEIIFGRKSPREADRRLVFKNAVDKLSVLRFKWLILGIINGHILILPFRSPQPRGNFDESGKWQPPSFRKAAPEDLERDARRSPGKHARQFTFEITPYYGTSY